MDETEYSEYGHSLETIAQQSNILIPKCDHILNSLIKRDFVERKKYMGSVSRNRYTLKDT